MAVPTSGNFDMFGSGTTTIAGAIVEGGGSVSGLTTFSQLIAAATVSKFDATYAGTISSLSDVSSSLQFRNYPASDCNFSTGTAAYAAAATPTPTPTPTLTPTPTPSSAGATTNTFNNTNGPAKLFPASSLGFGSWSLSINNSTGFSLEVDSSGMGGGYSVTASTVFTTPSPDYAKINLAGTSSATSIGFTIVGQNITNNNITGTSTLKITDGTNMYNGTGVAGTGSDSNKFTVTFNIGSAKGRTLYWGTSSTNASKGELDIGAQ